MNFNVESLSAYFGHNDNEGGEKINCFPFCQEMKYVFEDQDVSGFVMDHGFILGVPYIDWHGLHPWTSTKKLGVFHFWSSIFYVFHYMLYRFCALRLPLLVFLNFFLVYQRNRLKMWTFTNCIKHVTQKGWVHLNIKEPIGFSLLNYSQNMRKGENPLAMLLDWHVLL